MGLMRWMLVCVLWGCLTLFSVSSQSDYKTEFGTGETFHDGSVQPRGKHRLQLLFPLLLRISTRLATLVSTALTALLGIVLFVVFSKKAFIISLFALLLSLSDKYRSKGDDIYIHKVNSYPDYNGEEHIHYHHREPLHYKKHYKGNRPYQKWKHIKRNLPSPPPTLRLTSWNPGDRMRPFKPLSIHLTKRTAREEDANAQDLPGTAARGNRGSTGIIGGHWCSWERPNLN